MCNELEIPQKDFDTLKHASDQRFSLFPPLITVTENDIQVVPGNGWCFYDSMLRAAKKDYSTPITVNDCRKFALRISKTILLNVNDAVMNEDYSYGDDVSVMGNPLKLTNAQYYKLLSIPNLNNSSSPCLYPEIFPLIGLAAALILQKNIIVYQNGNAVASFCVIESNEREDQIWLHRTYTGGEHYDIIKHTWGKSKGGSKKRTTKRNTNHNIKTNRLTKRNNKHDVNVKRRFTKRKRQ